jgi:type I restriction enzyme S subunit
VKTVVPSIETVKPNPDWASLPIFDRTGWKRVRFGDVVDNCNETERDPESVGIDRFIGMEHLEPGSLHVRSWGSVADGTTFTRRCRPGQVLFGKRRAYQRKVAVAEFEALVSGDIYVLNPKDNKYLLPKLLPFLCMSERFFQHAVGTSAGSLSPRTNWSSLASFEFDLPPLDQQRRIAEILWAVDEALQCWVATDASSSVLRKAIVADFMSVHSADFHSLGDFLEEVQYGSSSKSILQPDDGLYPVLRIPNVIGEKIDFTDLVWAEASSENEKYHLIHGDVLIVRTNGNPDYVGRTAVYAGSRYDECIFASYLIRLRPYATKLLPHFLHNMLGSELVKKEIRKQVKSSAGNYNLNTQGIRGLKIPIPSLKVQRALLSRLGSVSTAISDAGSHSDSVREVSSAFSKSLFGTFPP